MTAAEIEERVSRRIGVELLEAHDPILVGFHTEQRLARAAIAAYRAALDEAGWQIVPKVATGEARAAMDAAHGALVWIAAPTYWGDPSPDGPKLAPEALAHFAETKATELDKALSRFTEALAAAPKEVP